MDELYSSFDRAKEGDQQQNESQIPMRKYLRRSTHNSRIRIVQSFNSFRAIEISYQGTFQFFGQRAKRMENDVHAKRHGF